MKIALQIYRHFLKDWSRPQLDGEGRIRIDDWEMRDDIQQSVAEDWKNKQLTTFQKFQTLRGIRVIFKTLDLVFQN